MKERNYLVNCLKTAFVLLMVSSYIVLPSAREIEDELFLDDSKKQLIIPLKNIESVYYDNKTDLPKKEHSDTYYARVSDQIVFKELSKSFKTVELLTDSADIEKIYTFFSYDKDSGKIVQKKEFTDILKEIALKYKADFIVMTQFCQLSYKTLHQNNWRDARGGSSYERPEKVMASAEFSLVFIQKNGVINREIKGSAKSGKPLFYPYVKKGKYEKNVVENSRKKYAPPLIKVLSKSIGDAFKKL